MSYENAPSTILLATHCAICGRPLRDAVSVDAGIGPDCAEKYGFPYGGIGDSAEANVLIHKIAALEVGPEVPVAIARIRELGFENVASILEERLAAKAARAKIEIEEKGAVLEVATPRPTDEQLAAFRAIPGRRWDPARRVNIIPAARRRDLFTALRKAYPGELATGPKGVFRIPA